MGLCIPTQTNAATSKKVTIEEIEYKGKGRVEVDFSHDVSYKNLKISVKDSTKKSYTVKIVSKDNDELKFNVVNFKQGTKYTLTISGIKRKGASTYGSVSSSFRIPAAQKPIIKKIECDLDNNEISVEFKNRVMYNNAKVSIKDSNGKNYTAKITDKDDDEIEISVRGLKRGKKYIITIIGIKHVDAKSYGSISKTFTAYND